MLEKTWKTLQTTFITLCVILISLLGWKNKIHNFPVFWGPFSDSLKSSKVGWSRAKKTLLCPRVAFPGINMPGEGGGARGDRAEEEGGGGAPPGGTGTALGRV